MSYVGGDLDQKLKRTSVDAFGRLYVFAFQFYALACFHPVVSVGFVCRNSFVLRGCILASLVFIFVYYCGIGETSSACIAPSDLWSFIDRYGPFSRVYIAFIQYTALSAFYELRTSFGAYGLDCFGFNIQFGFLA